MKSTGNLHLFCQYILQHYGDPKVASEEQKAADFRKVYLNNLPTNLSSLQAVAAACGIRTRAIEGNRMPADVRGYHEISRDRKSIYYREEDTLSGIQNTILHEIREMMETVFADICPGYEPIKQRHLAANRFATAVLLPQEDFLSQVYETGLDVLELGKHYCKSSSQILLRMGEVLQGKLFFYGALYEASLNDNNQDIYTVRYWTRTVNQADPEANLYGADSFFPCKGTKARPGSLVDMVKETVIPHIVRSIYLTGGSEEGELTALARPQIVDGAIIGVALIVLLSQDRNLIEPQIERAKPVIVERFHGHL